MNEAESPPPPLSTLALRPKRYKSMDRHPSAALANLKQEIAGTRYTYVRA